MQGCAIGASAAATSAVSSSVSRGSGVGGRESGAANWSAVLRDRMPRPAHLSSARPSASAGDVLVEGEPSTAPSSSCAPSSSPSRAAASRREPSRRCRCRGRCVAQHDGAETGELSLDQRDHLAGSAMLAKSGPGPQEIAIRIRLNRQRALQAKRREPAEHGDDGAPVTTPSGAARPALQTSR